MSPQEYIQFCNDKLIEILLILRTQPAPGADLKFFANIEDKVFDDVLAIMRDECFVDGFDDGALYWITDKGRIYVLKNAQNVKIQTDGSIYRSPNLNLSTPDIIHSAYWKHDIAKLPALAFHLKTDKFIESENDFIKAIGSAGSTKCNWIRNHTSLLYLLCGICIKSPRSIPAFVRDIAHNSFLVKGIQKSVDEIRTTSAKVKPHLQKQEYDLRGEYLKLFLILEKSLQ